MRGEGGGALQHERFIKTALAGVLCALAQAAAAAPEAGPASPAREILKELIEINTTDSSGSTTLAAEAMSARLRGAGFAAADLAVLGPDARKGNLVVRYRGRRASRLKPILLIGHLDVVEARREDWSTDPFKLVEQDGYFYGRGTLDMKGDDAILVAAFLRMKREGYVPDRDLILALTADEEGGAFNGVDWLLTTHRQLIDAEFVINPDGGRVATERGRPVAVEIEATEKLYADFEVSATNPGGHSSLPKPDNAIYQVADALALLQRTPFPLELNPVTREYFTQIARIETPQNAADLRAMLQDPPDEAAVRRLSQDTHFNATLRTTCTPTMISGGHAFNALPQKAAVNVNCRILPGHSQEDIRLQLVRLFADPGLSVRYRADSGAMADQAPDRSVMKPPPPREDVLGPLRRAAAQSWPGVPVVPIMETVATDSLHTMMAGIPSYGICGLAFDRDDDHRHGRDERVKVKSFDDAVEFYYRFLKALSSGS